MKCSFCETEMIIGGSHDREDDPDHPLETNASCPKCDAFVIIYHPREYFDEDV